MSIQDEINRITSALQRGYDKIAEMGGTVPEVSKIADLASYIASIPTADEFVHIRYSDDGVTFSESDYLVYDLSSPALWQTGGYFADGLEAVFTDDSSLICTIDNYPLDGWIQPNVGEPSTRYRLTVSPDCDDEIPVTVTKWDEEDGYLYAREFTEGEEMSPFGTATPGAKVYAKFTLGPWASGYDEYETALSDGYLSPKLYAVIRDGLTEGRFMGILVSESPVASGNFGDYEWHDINMPTLDVKPHIEISTNTQVRRQAYVPAITIPEGGGYLPEGTIKGANNAIQARIVSPTDELAGETLPMGLYYFNGDVTIPDGMSLPALSSPAMPGDVLYPKEYITDEGEVITGELTYDENGIIIPQFSVEDVGADYGFVLNSVGYYESTNNAVNSSASVCKLAFKCFGPTTLKVHCINYAESSYDYGILSTLDKTLGLTYTADTSNVQKSFKGADYQLATEQTVSYTGISAGKHFIYIKYRKDSSANKNNDSLQFRVEFVPEVEYDAEDLPDAEYTLSIGKSTAHELIPLARVTSSGYIEEGTYPGTGLSYDVIDSLTGGETITAGYKYFSQSVTVPSGGGGGGNAPTSFLTIQNYLSYGLFYGTGGPGGVFYTDPIPEGGEITLEVPTGALIVIYQTEDEALPYYRLQSESSGASGAFIMSTGLFDQIQSGFVITLCAPFYEGERDVITFGVIV